MAKDKKTEELPRVVVDEKGARWLHEPGERPRRIPPVIVPRYSDKAE